MCVKLVAACSLAKGFQVKPVAVDAKEVCVGCWQWLSADYQKD